MSNKPILKTRPSFKKTLLCTAIAMSVMGVHAEEVKTEKEDQIEVIEVTGLRDSIMSAIVAKRDADTVTDSINAEDIGKFPDSNMAESLQRVTGIQISREGSEGTAVSIRGLAPSFTRVTINGQSAASADSRAGFDFSMLSPAMAESIEVMKSVTANVEEGGMGGTVNIKTRRPLSFDEAKAQIAVKGSYDDFSEETDPSVNFMGLKQFFDNKFGVLFNAKYSERNHRQDSIFVKGWKGVTFDDDVYTAEEADGVNRKVGDPKLNDIAMGKLRYRSRMRESIQYDLNTTLQYRPNDNTEYYAEFTYGTHERSAVKDNYVEFKFDKASGKNSNYTSHELLDNGNDIFTVMEAAFKPGKVDIDLKDQLEDYEFTTETVVLGGKWTTDDWLIESALSYSKGTYFQQKYNAVLQIDSSKYADPNDPNNEGTLGYNVNPDDPMNAGKATPLTVISSLPLNELAMWEGGCDAHSHLKCKGIGGGGRDVDEENFSANIDLARSVELGDISEIKFGARYRDRTRESAQYKNSSPAGDVAFPSEFTDNFGAGNNVLSAMGDIQLPYMYDGGAYIRESLTACEQDENGNDTENCGLETRELLQAPQYAWANEKTYAMYGMANLEGELKFTDLEYEANFGVRAIFTDNTSEGLIDTGEVASIDSFHRTQETNDYWDILPSANLAVMATGNTVVRFAVAKVMTRPDLEDVNSSYQNAGNIEEKTVYDSFGISKGNPMLEPYRAWQYDIAVEYYSDTGGMVNLGLFYKDIDSLIAPQALDMSLAENCFSPSDASAGTQFLPGGQPGVIGGKCYLDNQLESVNPEDGALTEHGTLEYDTVVNSTGATIKGLEFGVTQFFTDILPSPFDGLGIQANYTYIDSDSGVKDVLTGEELAMEGVSENSYNLVLMYEKYDFSGRIAYNYRDEFVTALDDVNAGSSISSDDRGQLDASISYDINKEMSITISGVNLTDEHTSEYITHQSRVHDWSQLGRRYQAGFSWKF